MAHCLRRGGLRLRQAGADHRRRAGREDHPPVRRRRAVLSADGHAGGFRTGARPAGRYPGSRAGLGPLVGAARVDPVAAPRLAGASAPGGDRVRGHAAGERRARRHRVGSGRQRQYNSSQWGPPHPAVRLRGARCGGEPHRGRARGTRLCDQIERDDAVVRHRSRGADRLLVPRQDIGRRVGRARGLFHRRHGRDPDSARQVHHVPLVAPPPGRGALPTCRAGSRSRGGEGVSGPARQPAALSRRLLGLQRRGGARQPGVAADHPVQPVSHVPGDGAGRGRRRAGQGPDRARIRRALFLGHRDLRAAVPHLYQAADRAEPAPPAARLPGRGARTRTGGEPARGAVSVAHHQRQRGVRVLRGGNGAVPHQRGHRLRAPQVRGRHRGQGLSEGRGRGDSGRDGPPVGRPRFLRPPRRQVPDQRRDRAGRVQHGSQQQPVHEPDGPREPLVRRGDHWCAVGRRSAAVRVAGA